MGNVYHLIVLRRDEFVGNTNDGNFIACPDDLQMVSVHGYRSLEKAIALIKEGQTPNQVQGTICDICLESLDLPAHRKCEEIRNEKSERVSLQTSF